MFEYFQSDLEFLKDVDDGDEIELQNGDSDGEMLKNSEVSYCQCCNALTSYFIFSISATMNFDMLKSFFLILSRKGYKYLAYLKGKLL